MVNTRSTSRCDGKEVDMDDRFPRAEDPVEEPGPSGNRGIEPSLQDVMAALMRIETRVGRLEDDRQAHHEETIRPEHPNRDMDRFQEPERDFRRINLRPADNMSSIKQKIPGFKGSPDADEYLEWKDHMERIFRVNNFSEVRKVDLAISEFTDFAAVWWREQERKRTRAGFPEVATWAQLVRQMDIAFIPTTYERSLKVKLQELKQGSRTVQEYYHELIKLRLKARVEEDDASTQARFLQGLNMSLRHTLAVMDFVDIEQMVSKAVIIESQQREIRDRGRTFGGQASNRSFGGSQGSRTFGEQSQTHRWDPQQRRPLAPPTVATKTAAEPNTTDRSNTEQKTKRMSEIECFKCQGRGHYADSCPNTRTMVIRGGQDIIESDDEEDELAGRVMLGYEDDNSYGFQGFEEEPSSEEDVDGKASPHRQVMVVSRTLSVQPVEDSESEEEDKLKELVAKYGDPSLEFHGYEEESADSDSDEPTVADLAKANRIALLHMIPLPDARTKLKDVEEFSCTPAASGSHLDSRSNPCQPGGNDVIIRRTEEDATSRITKEGIG